MAKSLKTAGMSELGALKRRVTRQLALRRISMTEHNALIDQINILENMITKLNERGGDLDGED